MIMHLIGEAIVAESLLSGIAAALKNEGGEFK